MLEANECTNILLPCAVRTRQTLFLKTLFFLGDAGSGNAKKRAGIFLADAAQTGYD